MSNSQGRVLLPGAGFLEMGHACSSTALAPTAGKSWELGLAGLTMPAALELSSGVHDIIAAHAIYSLIT